MREICYRGRCIKDDDMYGWVQGYYVCLEDIWKKRKTHRIYNGFAECDCGEFYADYYEVDPETVGQFTGLVDKNGKRIYEGDIICFRGKEWVGYEEVFWCKSDFQWRLRNKHISGGSRELELDDEEWGEVVGNIHDNPELLG